MPAAPARAMRSCSAGTAKPVLAAGGALGSTPVQGSGSAATSGSAGAAWPPVAACAARSPMEQHLQPREK